MVYSTVLIAQTVVGSSPSLNLNQCLWTCLQAHGLKRLSCHADLYTVSRCHTRGESGDHTGEKAHKKGSIRADVTQSTKQGYQWSIEKDLYPPKILKIKVTKLSLHGNVFKGCVQHGMRTLVSGDLMTSHRILIGKMAL